MMVLPAKRRTELLSVLPPFLESDHWLHGIVGFSTLTRIPMAVSNVLIGAVDGRHGQMLSLCVFHVKTALMMRS